MPDPRKDNKALLRVPRKPTPKGKSFLFHQKYRKQLIAVAIAVLIALIIIIINSSIGTVENNTNNNTPQVTKIPTKIYSAGGIYLEYPASWKITTDEVNGNNMQIVIQDPASVNNTNSSQLAAFTILKVQKDPYQTLEQRKDAFIQSVTNSGANIAPTNTTNITVNGMNATQTIYSGNGPKYEPIQLKIVYFEEKNIVYIMAFLTKGTDLQSQAPYFDVILNSFKIQ